MDENIELKKYEELKDLLKAQQEIVKTELPNNLQEILNINKTEEVTKEDIKNCGIILINNRKEKLIETQKELFIKLFTKTNVCKKELKLLSLELFLLQEILKQMIDEEYFINKDYDTYLVYSYKNNEVYNYEINSLNYLKDIPIFKIKEIKIKGVLPNDIYKITDFIFPDYFIIPFNQKDFIEYTLKILIYTFINIPQNILLNIPLNISIINFYKEIFDEDLFKGVKIKIKDLYLKVLNYLNENKKEYVKIFTKQFDLKF